MHTELIIKVPPECKLGELQAQFNHYFPYLKLEFYANADLKKGRSSKPALGPNTPMYTRMNGNEYKEFTVSETMTVAELEQKIRDVFGMNAEVLRKSGNVWLETNLTSNWTLQQQNTMGISIS